MQPEVMMRRSSLQQVGGHRADIPEASDFNLWLRLASVGSVARVDGPIQGMYRIHPQSMQRTIHAGKLSDLNARWRAFELFFAERGDAIGAHEWLRSTACRTFARDAIRLAARAYDTDSPIEEPVQEYLDFALRLDQRGSQSPQHVAVRLRRALHGRGLHRLTRLTPGAAMREVEDRLRWRYWRRYGL